MDYAIFKAIINKVNCPKGFMSSCTWENNKFKFTATKETFEQLTKNSKGYVYVFDKLDFKKRSASEWISYRKVNPVEKVEVCWSNFTQEIDIMEDDMPKK